MLEDAKQGRVPKGWRRTRRTLHIVEYIFGIGEFESSDDCPRVIGRKVKDGWKTALFRKKDNVIESTVQDGSSRSDSVEYARTLMEGFNIGDFDKELDDTIIGIRDVVMQESKKFHDYPEIRGIKEEEEEEDYGSLIGRYNRRQEDYNYADWSVEPPETEEPENDSGLEDDGIFGDIFETQELNETIGNISRAVSEFIGISYYGIGDENVYDDGLDDVVYGELTVMVPPEVDLSYREEYSMVDVPDVDLSYLEDDSVEDLSGFFADMISEFGEVGEVVVKRDKVQSLNQVVNSIGIVSEELDSMLYGESDDFVAVPISTIRSLYTQVKG